MVTKLSDLEIDEVSLVDVPVNKKRIVYKGGRMKKISKESEMCEEKKTASTSAAQEAAAEVIMAAEEAQQSAGEAVAAAEAAARVAEAVSGAEEEVPTVEKEDEDHDEEEVEIKPPKYCEHCGELLEDGKCPECYIGKSTSSKASKVNKAFVELQKAKARIAALENAARTARDALVTKEFIEKASKEFSHLPGVSTEQLGVVLKNASETMKPEHYKTLVTVLKSSDAVLSQNILTRTLGVKSESGLLDGSAASRLHMKATELMNSVQKSGEKLTYEKAYMKAMHENPTLYQEYLSGR